MMVLGLSRIKLATNQAFYRIKSAVRIGDHLAFGRCADQTFSSIRHNGRGGVITFAVGNHLGFIAFHHGYTRVCGAEVNTNYFAHLKSPEFKSN